MKDLIIKRVFYTVSNSIHSFKSGLFGLSESVFFLLSICTNTYCLSNQDHFHEQNCLYLSHMGRYVCIYQHWVIQVLPNLLHCRTDVWALGLKVQIFCPRTALLFQRWYCYLQFGWLRQEKSESKRVEIGIFTKGRIQYDHLFSEHQIWIWNFRNEMISNLIGGLKIKCTTHVSII